MPWQNSHAFRTVREEYGLPDEAPSPWGRQAARSAPSFFIDGVDLGGEYRGLVRDYSQLLGVNWPKHRITSGNIGC
jgi:hypothetical protein